MTSRQDVRATLDDGVDLVVVGGGITGAAVLLAAARAGVRAALLEAHDFASGTSSRSSKMIHGGLRYLRNLQVSSTFGSLRERRRLVREQPTLVRPLDNTLLAYESDRHRPWLTGLGLAVYDAMALTWAHQRESPEAVAARVPGIATGGLVGAHRYAEATTDDARLVLTVLAEAQCAGGLALNYARVEAVQRDASGRVAGVAVRDLVSGDSLDLPCRAVVNATGAWGDELRAADGRKPVLRRLRGSHLFFPADRFPLPVAVSFMHPSDGRPVFAYPWQGVTLVGTTDVDHELPMTTDLRCTPSEADYLMAAVHKTFPSFGLEASDAVSSIAGVRPVVRGRQHDPSKESRESLLLDENGLISIVGGKLTTFWPMGRRAADAALRYLGDVRPQRPRPLTLAEAEGTADGDTASALVAGAVESVVHLDDLLLRRTRLGLTSPDGGRTSLLSVRAAVQAALGWDDERWSTEEDRYLDLWNRYYSPPGHPGASAGR
jgi:glycerol-3-phosphate dehydrogenase